MNLTDLGISPEDLREQIIERAAEKLAEQAYEYDWQRPARELVQNTVKAEVAKIAAETVEPLIAGKIEEIILQRTNDWGEAKGEKVSFRQYLVHRAEAYIVEKVNYDGKDKAESNGYGWSGTQTRITHLINKHLHHEIEKAMKEALSTATNTIAKGIHETARLKLNEIAASMKVAVTTK